MPFYIYDFINFFTHTFFIALFAIGSLIFAIRSPKVLNVLILFGFMCYLIGDLIFEYMNRVGVVASEPDRIFFIALLLSSVGLVISSVSYLIKSLREK